MNRNKALVRRKLPASAVVITAALILIAASPVTGAGSQGGKAPTFTVDRYLHGDYVVVNPAEPDESEPSQNTGRTNPPNVVGFELVADRTTGERAIVDTTLLTSKAAREAPAMVAVTAEFVDLSWAALPAIDEYRVYRDDSLVTQLAATSFRDANVEPGKAYAYRIEAVLPDVDASGKIWGLVAVIPETEAGDALALGAEFQQMATVLASYNTAAIMHQTFIPQDKISAPPAGCTYNAPNQYGGDDRGFLPSGYPSRTLLRAEVGFSGSGTVTTTSASIGATKAYNSSGTLLDTKTATGTTLTATRLAASSGTSVDVRFVIDATNPFCTSVPNSISAVFTMTVTKSGAWSIISGLHKQMPNHELYLHGDSVGWVTAYQRTYASAYCLVNGACPNASMSGYYGYY